MADFWIKKNDTSPNLEAILKDSDDNPVDITGSTVRFHMGTFRGVNKIDAAAVIVDASAGHVRYDWVTGDTDTAGFFHAEWQVTFSGGAIETFPNDTHFDIEVVEDLA